MTIQQQHLLKNLRDAVQVRAHDIELAHTELKVLLDYLDELELNEKKLAVEVLYLKDLIFKHHDSYVIRNIQIGGLCTVCDPDGSKSFETIKAAVVRDNLTLITQNIEQKKEIELLKEQVLRLLDRL